jgi:hypothetical protein
VARFDYNPLTNQLDLVDSPAGYINGVVADPTLLPVTLGAPALDSVYLAKAGSGLWLISRKPAGLYCRVANNGNAADWQFLGAFPEVNADGNWALYSSADPTKELKFQLSGITTGTTRTLTVPDASGTLPLLETANTFTQNQTLDGTNNVAPNQTAASSSSLMTRSLGDARYRVFYMPMVWAANATFANAGSLNMRPFTDVNAAYVAVPSWARKVRLHSNVTFTTQPVALTFVAELIAYRLTDNNSQNTAYTPISTANLTTTQVWTNSTNQWRHSMVLNTDLILPSAGITDAETQNFWAVILRIKNDSGGSLTTENNVFSRAMAIFTE